MTILLGYFLLSALVASCIQAMGNTVSSNVRINEILAIVQFDPASPPADPLDELDWIELQNIGSSTIDLSGWTLEDDDKPLKATLFRFPTGTSVASGSFITLYATDGTPLFCHAYLHIPSL
jgi:hypothetical protein